MRTHNSSVLFNPGGCLNAATFKCYLDNTLRPVEKTRVEDHLRHCLICSEALEGYKRHRNNNFIKSDLEFLSGRIRKRFSSNRPAKLLGIPGSIMITLFVFLIILLIVYFIIQSLLAIPQN